MLVTANLREQFLTRTLLPLLRTSKHTFIKGTIGTPCLESTSILYLRGTVTLLKGIQH